MCDKMRRYEMKLRCTDLVIFQPFGEVSSTWKSRIQKNWYTVTVPLTASDWGLVELHNRSSVGIDWCIRCNFAKYNWFAHIHWINNLGGKFKSICILPCLCICAYVKGHNWFSLYNSMQILLPILYMAIFVRNLPCVYISCYCTSD